MQEISSSAAPAAIGPYSQAVEQNGLIFISGQFGIDADTGQLCAENAREQMARALINLGHILSAAGLKVTDVVKVTIFLTDMADFPAVNEEYARFFSAPFPARACVAVAGLPKSAKVEVEALAIRPS